MEKIRITASGYSNEGCFTSLPQPSMQDEFHASPWAYRLPIRSLLGH